MPASSVNCTLPLTAKCDWPPAVGNEPPTNGGPYGFTLIRSGGRSAKAAPYSAQCSSVVVNRATLRRRRVTSAATRTYFGQGTTSLSGAVGMAPGAWRASGYSLPPGGFTTATHRSYRTPMGHLISGFPTLGGLWAQRGPLGTRGQSKTMLLITALVSPPRAQHVGWPPHSTVSAPPRTQPHSNSGVQV
jgi:hypothetical protein